MSSSAASDCSSLSSFFLLLVSPFMVSGFLTRLVAVMGIYEWDTVQEAENYASSFAMKFMTMRSVSGSVSCEIIPKQVS